ncbi:MAG: hypothetical protein U1F37_14070 [Alphaproteobacteria bacterium]
MTYVRDALGRVTSVTTKDNAGASAVNVATSIAYMPFGPIASLIHGNSLTATFTWDQDYRLTGLVTAQGGTTIQNLAYGYNLVDNVTAITDNLATARNQSFTLDDLQRLVSATGAYGAITYSYDAADNRLTRNLAGGPAETFTYGTTDNRLQSAAVTGQPLRSFTTNAAGDIASTTGARATRSRSRSAPTRGRRPSPWPAPAPPRSPTSTTRSASASPASKAPRRHTSTTTRTAA